MPVIRTEEYNDFNNLIEVMDNTTDKIEALSSMIEYTMKSGNDVSHLSIGVERILKQQCDDLNFLRKALARHYNKMRALKLEVSDLAMVAKWSNVKPAVAKRVITVATGICLEDCGGDEPSEMVEIGYRASIVKAMQSVANVKAIATETGVAEEDVTAILYRALILRPGDEAFYEKPQQAQAPASASFNDAFGHEVAPTNMGG